MRAVLAAAAAVNLAAGAALLAAPAPTAARLGLDVAPLPLPTRPLAVLVVVLGGGYALAARDPVAHRGWLVAGAAGKVGGGALGLWTVLRGTLPRSHLLTVLLTDVAWLPPFAVVLRRVPR